MYVFGGLGPDAVELSDIYCLNLSTNHWTQIKPNSLDPPPLWGHSAVIFGPKMFIFGGFSNRKFSNVIYSFEFGTFPSSNILRN